MTRKISLYIADTEVDLGENSLILYNYAMTDLTNPTAVKNSYSKQITLKGTKTNNKLFGSFFRLDRVTSYADSYTGVHFDPMRKTPFKIFDSAGLLLESGYVKLNSVSKNGADIEYNISLYGGLGSFLYQLMYNEDGSKKTLYDLPYTDLSGTFGYQTFRMRDVATDGVTYLKNAWTYVDAKSGTGFWNIINFAPCYNGFPSDFECNKAICKSGEFSNTQFSSKTDGGKTYKPKFDTYALIKFTNKHTEWEVRDLRWYLQRPVVSFRAIMDSIVRTYDVVLDESFFNEQNKSFYNAWITLPFIPSDKRVDEYCLASVMQSSLTPADYLLSYIKIFGLLIYRDGEKIHISQRKNFYKKDSIIDLTNRVNLKSAIKVSPYIAETQIYQLGSDAKGEYATEYKADYGVDYGVQRIDTGYEFNSETSVLTKDVKLKDAAEVLESNRLFAYGKSTVASTSLEAFMIPAYEAVNVVLWENGTDTSSKEFPITYSAGYEIKYDNNSVPYGDIFPKMQFHEKENAATDGSNVLVIYKGDVTTPGRKWLLTADATALFDDLNDGKPCWLMSKYFNEVYRAVLPSFGRMVINDNVVTESLDWGIPKALGIAKTTINEDASVYSRYWKGYLSQMYDDDAKKMTCKVNLKGLQVNELFLSNFFWYDNAMWALNKISNHSLTTDDDTECEFIKIQDVNKFIG